MAGVIEAGMVIVAFTLTNRVAFNAQLAADQEAQQMPLAEQDYALGEALNLLKGLAILGAGKA